MYVIDLKKEGDFSTVFADNIVGDLNKDKFIVAECTKKDGTEYSIQIATDGISTVRETSQKVA